MPRPKSVSSYCLHKPSGRARIILDSKQIYLGVYGSPESREQYVRIIAERFQPGRVADGGAAVATATHTGFDLNLSINELALRYIQFAETYYVRDGQPTSELHNICQ